MGDECQERWLTIKGYPDYQVSDLGRVKSLARKGEGNAKRERLKDRILKTHSMVNEYKTITLISPLQKRKTRQVHRLVLEVFSPTDNKKLQCNHKNLNKHDNRLENLEWVTAKRNINHFRENNPTELVGEKHYRAILTEREVLEIRKQAVTKTYQQIGNEFGVGRHTVGRIVRRQNWKHI